MTVETVLTAVRRPTQRVLFLNFFLTLVFYVGGNIIDICGRVNYVAKTESKV